MRRFWFAAVLCAIVFLAQSSLFFILPSLGSGVFLSPDETAVATSARVFGQQANMRIEDKLLTEGPWIHPRSYVTQGSAMVPVGFLGLPLVLSAVWRLAGDWGLAMFVPLLVMSAGFPLWRLLRRFGPYAAAIAVTIWLSFPTVILYANRGLFPNLAALCFVLWGIFFLTERKSLWWTMTAGFCAGVAVAIRPTEVIWIVPWFWFAWSLKPSTTKLRFVSFGAAAAFPCLLAAFAAWTTYGSPFTIGYWLRDPVVMAATGVVTNAATHLWPFGLHPRNVWFNLRWYVFSFIGPWTVVILIALAQHVKNKKSWKLIGVCLWTIASLAVLYGEAIYQDHVGVNVVSLGNSYLRYLIPLAAISALAAAALVAWLERRLGQTRGRGVAVCGAFLLAITGASIAIQSSGEGVLAGNRELQRYVLIRQTTLNQFGPQAIIVSERSDKIFFPTFRVATPVPDFETLRPLVANAPVPTLLFTETLDGGEQAMWSAEGFLLRPVFRTENQTLYEMYPHATSTQP